MITILTLIFSGFGVVASVILVTFIGLVIHFSIVDWMEKRKSQAELHKKTAEEVSGMFLYHPSRKIKWEWLPVDGCEGEIETPGIIGNERRIISKAEEEAEKIIGDLLK